MKAESLKGELNGGHCSYTAFKFNCLKSGIGLNLLSPFGDGIKATQTVPTQCIHFYNQKTI